MSRVQRFLQVEGGICASFAEQNSLGRKQRHIKRNATKLREEVHNMRSQTVENCYAREKLTNHVEAFEPSSEDDETVLSRLTCSFRKRGN